MSTTAYSVDRCQGTYDDGCQGTYDYSSGTTYYYSTTRSPHDRLATRPCSETIALRPALSHARTHASEPLCRRISLTDSMFTPPPENHTYRRSISDYTGATHHPCHTTRRLTQQASAPFVVSLRACATLRLAQAPLVVPPYGLPANTNQLLNS